MLVKVLGQHVTHPDFGAQITELQNHVISREADKFFYVCMIRKFEPDHEIFKPNYMPPSKPRKVKDSQFISESALEMY